MRITRTLAVACTMWVGALVAAPVVAGGCEACHGDPGLLVKNRKLYDYYQDWLTSPHKQAGVTCDQCHGGDPGGSDKDAAHAGRAPVVDPNSTVFFRAQPATCGRCHQAVSEQFTQSRHCSKVLSQDMAPSCATCHRAMNKKPYYRDILREGCMHCHRGEPGRPGPEVIDRAGEILHRLNIARGFLGWTSLHFEREGWPDDSRQTVDGLRRDYHAVLARVHSLELLAADAGSTELLTTLKRIFNEHRASGGGRAGG